MTFYRDVLGLELDGDLWDRNRAFEAAMDAGWIYFHDEFAMVCEPPVELHREEPNGEDVRQLHRLDGPAIRWADGVCMYFIRGIRIDSPGWIEDSNLLTVKRIRDEENAEVRRVMIDSFGADRYLRESGAVEVSSDQYGRLLRAPVQGDEDLVMVEVVNGSPEPIGYEPSEGENGRWVKHQSPKWTDALLEWAFGRPRPEFSRWYKHYMLRVPPSTKTAHEGVAWTYNLKPEEYAPVVRT